MESQRIYGLSNEEKIISYLNKKKFYLLNEKWKGHICKIFPNVHNNDLIFARHYPDNCSKPDMIIEVDGEEKYVSIKTGKCPSVHQESFYSFKRFLSRLHVSYRTLETIRFFHFGDSKKLGINKNPLSRDELIKDYSSYFVEASKELDKEYIIKAVINRTVIRGTSSSRCAVDYLYYGDLEHGKLLSKSDIYDIVLANRNHGKSAIYFGGLIYMPSSRSVTRPERNYVRIKWSVLSLLYYCSDDDVEKMKKGQFEKIVGCNN